MGNMTDNNNLPRPPAIHGGTTTVLGVDTTASSDDGSIENTPASSEADDNQYDATGDDSGQYDSVPAANEGN